MLRLGVPTASTFDRIITPTGKPSAQADAYMFDLLSELVEGLPIDKVKTSWMQYGNDTEAKAVSYYDLQRDCESKPVGFMTNDEGTIGASPDRIVSDDLLLEVKCPSLPVQLSYLLSSKGVDANYKVQLQGQLYVSGFNAVDIISFHPRESVIIRVERDEAFIGLLDAELQKFVEKMAVKREQLDKRGLLAKTASERDHSADFLSDEDVERIIESRRVLQST